MALPMLQALLRSLKDNYVAPQMLDFALGNDGGVPSLLSTENNMPLCLIVPLYNVFCCLQVLLRFLHLSRPI